MQVLQAGRHKLILLEIDSATVSAVAQQAGFDAKLKESPRGILLELTAEQRETPLLLFDAADPANLGWFSRCQFYVDGSSLAIRSRNPLCTVRPVRSRLLATVMGVCITQPVRPST